MIGSTQYQRVHLADALIEVKRGVGDRWAQFPVLGATRDGVSLAKEPVGKAPERYKLVEPGTIFYNPMRILIGSIAFLDEDQPPGITSPDYVVFRTRPSVLHPRWFYYWLRSPAGSHFIRTLARGAVRERLLFRRLVAGNIPAPAFEVQQRFSEMVPAVERARAAAKVRLESARALDGSHLLQALQTSEGRQWPRVPLREVLRAPLKTGISRTSTASSTKRCLTLSTVRDGTLDLSFSKLSEVTDEEAERNWVLPGAFYVVRGNGNRSLVGRGGFAPLRVDSPVLYPDLLIQVLLKEEVVTPCFFRFVWDSKEVRRDLEGRARTAAGIYKISQRSLAEVRLPVPPLPVQLRWGAGLKESKAHAKEIELAVATELAEINALPRAFLRKALYGNL